MTSKPTSPELSSPKKQGDLQAQATSRSNQENRVEARTRSRDSIVLEYPSDLPITGRREEVIEAIRNHSVVVLCGETGSGKSTQLPKLCIEAGRGIQGMIGHTQPRRLAAQSIASRLADETKTELGNAIGYQVRFGDRTSPETVIKQMTDGILLAETRRDRDLRAYDTIILDEAHERSLNIDFLLGYLQRLLARRDDLKVIITSATIDAERFAEHFGVARSPDHVDPAPILTVEGRSYPVELRYLPWEEVASDEEKSTLARPDLSRHVIAGLDNLSRDGAGDVLVFLPTERDIREVSHRVSAHYQRLGILNRKELLPLYARLPSSQQKRIFHPDGKHQRVIFATNVAESSLTVPGIRYVIDAGTARISRYSPRSRMQRLPIESISQASANQRLGRCGRVGPGICIRLYSEDDFVARTAYTTPEIKRTNLASVVLQTKALDLGPLSEFPLMDPPRPELVREGVATLREIQAIDDHDELTEIGRRLARLPVDPRVGRILIAAEEQGVLPEVLPIAAALEIQDPRDRPPDKREAADEAHQPFVDPESDFLSLLRLWKHYETLRSELSRNQMQKRLRRQFLSPSRMREWSDVYRQLRDMASSGLGRKRDKRVRLSGIRYAPAVSVPDQKVDRTIGRKKRLPNAGEPKKKSAGCCTGAGGADPPGLTNGIVAWCRDAARTARVPRCGRTEATSLAGKWGVQQETQVDRLGRTG